MKKVNILLIFFTFIITLIYADNNNFKIGYLGVSFSSKDVSNFNLMKFIISEKVNTSTFKIEPVFFNLNDKDVIDKIKNTENLVSLIGCFNNFEDEKLAQIKEKNIILLSTCLSHKIYKNLIFHIFPDEINLAKELARIQIGVLNKRKFAIVYDESEDINKEIVKNYIKILKENHAKVSYIKTITPGRKDFIPILLRIRELKVHVIFFVGSYTQGAILAKQSKKLNVGAQFSSTSTIYTRKFIKKAKKGAEGANFTYFYPWSIYSIKKFKTFIKKCYKEKIKLNEKSPYIYDAVNLIINGLKNNQNLLEYLKNVQYDGITGRINFDEKGKRERVFPYFYVIRGKSFLYRKLSKKEYFLYLKTK